MNGSEPRGRACCTSGQTFLPRAAALIAARSRHAEPRHAEPRDADAADGRDDIRDIDPAVLLWRDWLAARRLYEEACRRERRLEAEMLRQLGSRPRVKIIGSEPGSIIWAHTTEEIDRVLHTSGDEATRQEAYAQLAAGEADWNALDTRIGYCRAKRAKAEIDELEEALASDLWRASPSSVAGVAAKLHCLLQTEDTTSGLNDQPWPQFRMILADLVRIAGAGKDGTRSSWL